MSGPSDSASGGGIVCTVCRAALPSDATFCLMCGTRQTLRPPAPAPVRVNLGREATMLGLAPNAKAAAAAPSQGPRDTLIDASPGPSPSPGADPKRVASQHRTMLGMDSTAAPAEGPTNRLRSAQPPAAAPAPSRPADLRPASGRTAQGVMMPPPAGFSGPHEPTMPPPRRREPPLLGEPAMSSVSPPRRAPSPARSAIDNGEDLVVPGLARPRPRGPSLYLAAGLAVLGIGGLTAGLLLRARQAAAPLNAFVSATDGEYVTLTVAVPEARGGRIRAGNDVVNIDAAGRASLRAQVGAVGELHLPVTLTYGSVTEARDLRYFIAWRVAPQFNELGASPPRLLLEFHVPPDATLEVSRHPVRVVNGVGIASIDASAPLAVTDLDGARRYTFPVRVTRGGAQTEGEYALRVRRTPLRVEEPGRITATNASLLTVRGTAPQATRVTVGTVAARVQGDQFSADVALVPGPNTVDVIAYAPGGVPARQSLTIYQNVTPDAYLSASAGEHGAALLAAPREGARLRVRGRVLRALEAGPDGPTFQLLVSDRACPAAQCVAWVDPPRRTVVREGQEVEVVGEIQRARGYVATDGSRRSAPVIQALFLQ